MNRLYMPLILCVILPTLICKADVAPVTSPDSTINLGVLKIYPPKSMPSVQTDDIDYGFSTLTFNDGEAKDVVIDHKSPSGSGFSLVGTAEAAEMPAPIMLQDFQRMIVMVNDATRLEQLRPVLTEKNYKTLTTKVNSGVSQYTVLAMIQAMRPSEVRITDSHIDADRAELAVEGRSSYGLMKGVVRVTKNDGAWKIESEKWNAGDRDIKGSALNSGPHTRGVPTLFLDRVSPEYKINRNFLTLNKVPTTRSKRAFMFVFLMNGQKKDPGLDKEHKSRAHMHIMWPGSRKSLKEQKEIKDQYPVDVSIANYADGFSAGEWNLVLPNKKPREISISLLWSF